jgi:hypothetical protein
MTTRASAHFRVPHPARTEERQVQEGIGKGWRKRLHQGLSDMQRGKRPELDELVSDPSHWMLHN